MIGLLVAMRSVAYEDIAPRKNKRRALILQQRIKPRSLNGSRAVGQIGASGKVERMKTLGEAAAGFAQRHHIQCGLFSIHHRRADDTHAAIDVGAAEVRIVKIGGSPKVHMPDRRCCGRVVGIERIHAIVDRRDIHYIMPAARYLYVGHKQRLAINLIVHHPLEDHAELPGIDIGGCEHGLL